MTAKRMFLIDGSALYYRSYFAFIRNPLINSRGENTSASFGFALSLIKIIQDEDPDYLAVVFDTDKPTFRHQKYPEYKATREKMPEEMAEQFPRIQQLVKAFDIPWIEKDGYEADDIIATLARRAEKAGIEVYMVTADKDMMQLLSSQINMYRIRPGKEVEVIGPDNLQEELGLTPEQIIDYLALMGDSSDNIPGVPKVGDKTARQLLQEFGSMKAVYEQLDEVKKKSVRESLSEHREQANLSRELVVLDSEAPVEVDFDTLTWTSVNIDKVTPLFEELEFRSLIPRLQEGAAGNSTAAGQYDPKRQKYRLVDTPEKFQELVEQLEKQPFVIFDTETTGLDVFRSEILGIAFSWKKNQAYYVPLNDPAEKLPPETVWSAFKRILENPALKKGAQNIKFDALMLWQHGIELQGIAFDTMIANYLITSETRQNKLDTLAEKYLQYQMIPIEELLGKRGKNQKNMRDIPLEKVAPYACEDADITLQLKTYLEKQLAESGTEELFYAVEMPLVDVLMEMEKNGVSLDVPLLEQMSQEIGKEAEARRQEIFQLAGEQFNVNSPQQLGKILFDELQIHKELGKRPPRRTPTGQYSTSEAMLLKYRKHPVVDKILEYRRLAKLKSTYVDALPQLISERTGRLHTSFNQTVAATGRLSSSDPNLQNIPIRDQRGREIRKAFIPASPDHYILSADYSQVELRMMAHMSGDEALREAFLRGEDIHSTTAAAIFSVPLKEITPEQRRKAKEVNFGIIYGISRYGLAGRLDIAVEEAEQIIANYFARFPKVNDYIRNVIAFAREQKYVTTILNRRRYLPEIVSRNANVRQNAERMAINTGIQGSAADLIKKAMINIHQKLRRESLQAKMILQVHDELVFEVSEQELERLKTLVTTEMETALELSLPLKADVGVGKNWLEAH